MLEVELDHLDVLLEAEAALENAGVELVRPALPALLVDAPGKHGADLGPGVGAELFHELDEQFVFCFGPLRRPHKVGIFELHVAVVALDVGDAAHHFSNFDPVPGSLLSDDLEQFLVLQGQKA